MKIVALLTLFISLGITFASWTESHNGRPGCETDVEMTQKYWRNNYDPTKYFICETKHQPGEYASCQQEYLFDARTLTCIPLEEWVWTEPIDPPSLG